MIANTESVHTLDKLQLYDSLILNIVNNIVPNIIKTSMYEWYKHTEYIMNTLNRGF